MKILTMILAGGRGRELSVLTSHRAKTAVPFGGRYRIIDFCLSNCVHSGLNEIAILAQYNPKSLMEHIRMGKPWDLDRKSGGVYILQPTYHGEVANWYLGTADALYQNLSLIANSDADHVVILSGDQVYLMDYREMLSIHEESDMPLTIACKKVTARQRGRFGMVKMSRKGIVTDFREKPVSSTFKHASLGIYIFERKFLEKTLDGNKKDIVFDILMPMISARSVGAYLFDGYWEDIGSVPSYFNASMRLLRNRTLITRNDWPVFTRAEGLAPARYSDSSDVTGSIVGEGCRISGKVQRSIIFPGTVIESGAAVTDSIIYSGTRIGRGASVVRSILDKNVRIGKGVSTGIRTDDMNGEIMKDESMAIKGGNNRITVIGKGAKIAGDSKIPAGAVIEPGKRVRG